MDALLLLSQVILVDRLAAPHYYSVSWEDSPQNYIRPFFEGGHPEDQMVYSFANANRCILTRQNLDSFRTWLELARFCSAIFNGIRPTQIVGTFQVCHALPPLLFFRSPSLTQAKAASVYLVQMCCLVASLHVGCLCFRSQYTPYLR